MASCSRLADQPVASTICQPKSARSAGTTTWTLARALVRHYESGDDSLLEAYSDTCLRRVWRVQHFSWWMTSMLHRFDPDDIYQHRLQLAQLQYVTSSTAAATTLAENYVGLPM